MLFNQKFKFKIFALMIIIVRLRLKLIKLYNYNNKIMFMTKKEFDIFYIELNYDNFVVDDYELKK